MRHLATWTLTAVSAFIICALANPTDVRPAPRAPESRIPYPPPPPPPPPPPAAAGAGADQRAQLTGFNMFFAPYRLLNIDEAFFKKPAPPLYNPKVLWATKELERLHLMRDELNNLEQIVRYNTELERSQLPDYDSSRIPMKASYDYDTPNDYVDINKDIGSDSNLEIAKEETKIPSKEEIEKEEHKKNFALTPRNKEFYEPQSTIVSAMAEEGGMHLTVRRRGGFVGETEPGFQDIRQQRQNPNKVKTLVEEQAADSATIVTHAQARAWNEATLAAAGAARASSGADVHRVHVGRHQQDDTASLEGILVYTVVGCGLSVLILGVVFGWYTLSRKAKAAADVDYPAYGVTGPSGDNSGDRRLAHSAHMYHYQHQKQQIIAMERSGTDDRNGSISDPESEEENEEGDYTVYECPGFATTGDIEVKNPLFSDEPTPATPAAPATPAVPAAAGDIPAERANPSPAIVVIDDHTTE